MYTATRKKPERVDEIVKLCAVATKKISTQNARGRTKVTSAEIDYARLVLLKYGPSALFFSFAPNHSCLGRDRRPRGFEFRVQADAPLYEQPFSEHTMYSGTMAFPLDAGDSSGVLGSTGRPIPSDFFSKHALRRSVDKHITNGVLGNDPSAFAGIFSSTVRTAYDNETRYWAVVRVNDDKAGKDFFSLLCKHAASPGKVARGDDEFTTWASFFTDNLDVRDIQKRQKRHRATVLAKLIAACGLGQIVDGTFQQNVDAILESPHLIDCCTEVVEAVDGCLSLLSDMCSTKLITRTGTLVRDTGRLGFLVLRGPWAPPSEKFASNIAFPSSVSAQQVLVDNAGDKETMRSCNRFFWTDCEKDGSEFNLSLSVSKTNTRDERWKFGEQALGFDAQNGAIVLSPLCVKLQQTAQPK